MRWRRYAPRVLETQSAETVARAERAEAATDAAEEKIASLEAELYTSGKQSQGRMASLEMERAATAEANRELREALLAIDPFHPLVLEACNDGEHE